MEPEPLKNKITGICACCAWQDKEENQTWEEFKESWPDGAIQILFPHDIKAAVEWLKGEINKIVWDVAVKEGGSNIHYNDLLNEKIDQAFHDVTQDQGDG